MRFSVLAGTVLALSVLGAVMVGMGESAAKRERLAMAIADMRANGFLPAEGHGIPKEGGAYYERLEALQHTIPDNPKPAFETAFEFTDFDAARAFLDTHRATLDELEELVLGPDGQAAIQERGGHNPKMSTLLRTRRITNALCVRAVVAGSEGRGLDALRALTAALDFTYTLDHPSLINLMIEVSLDTLVARTWQRIDRDYGDRLGMRDFAEELGPRFARSASHDRVKLAMRGELVELLSHIESEGVLTSIDTTVSDMGLHAIEHYRAVLEEWGNECTAATWRVDCGSGCAFDRIQPAIHLNVRGYHVTRLALAIHRHRSKTGEWPDALAVLEGGALLDPCTHEEYRYKLTETEVRLWSEPPAAGVQVCGREPHVNNDVLDWRWER